MLPAHIRKRKTRSPVPDVKAGRLVDALLSDHEMARQAPSVPKPAKMIEKIRIIGDDVLTATDEAVYQLFLAWSRREGIERETHEIPFEAVRSYTRTARTDDLIESFKRLAVTTVIYDIRDDHTRRRGIVPLASTELTEDLLNGTAIVSFSLPVYIRDLMLSARSHAYLELRAFPHFKCRYTSRLYQRLALRAGYDVEVQQPWVIDPAKLAAEIGFKFTGAFRYIDFKRNCLIPALSDIEQHVRKFGVEIIETKAEASGRGRPCIGKITFVTTPKDYIAPLASLKSTKISSIEMTMITADDPVIERDFIPSPAAVSRVVHTLGHRYRPAQIEDSWRAAIEELSDGATTTSSQGDMDWLRDEIVSHDTDDVFYRWALRTDKSGAFPKRISRSPDYRPLTPITHIEDGREVDTPRSQMTDEQHDLRARDWAFREIDSMLEAVDGGSFYKPVIRSYCSSDLTSWTWVREKIGIEDKRLPRCLQILAGQDYAQQCRTLRNLGLAALESNFEKILQISSAVIASGKDSGTTDQAPVNQPNTPTHLPF